MDKSYIAKIESNGAYVYVYDGQSGRRIRSLGAAGSQGTNVSVQVNGNVVAITDNRGTTKLYDAESGRCLRTL